MWPDWVLIIWLVGMLALAVIVGVYNDNLKGKKDKPETLVMGRLGVGLLLWYTLYRNHWGDNEYDRKYDLLDALFHFLMN